MYGKELREQRLAKELSQEELAKETHSIIFEYGISAYRAIRE